MPHVLIRTCGLRLPWCEIGVTDLFELHGDIIINEEPSLGLGYLAQGIPTV